MSDLEDHAGGDARQPERSPLEVLDSKLEDVEKAKAPKKRDITELGLLLDKLNERERASLRWETPFSDKLPGNASWKSIVNVLLELLLKLKTAVRTDALALLERVLDAADGPAADARSGAARLQFASIASDLINTLANTLLSDADMRATNGQRLVRVLSKRVMGCPEYLLASTRVKSVALTNMISNLTKAGLEKDPATSAGDAKSHEYLTLLSTLFAHLPFEASIVKKDNKSNYNLSAHAPAITLRPLFAAATGWLERTGRGVTGTVASLDTAAAAATGAFAPGGAAAASAAASALVGPGLLLQDSVVPLVRPGGGRRDIELWIALLSALATALERRGRTAHAALRAHGSSVIAFATLGRNWADLERDKRALQESVNFLLLALSVTAAAYSAERGGDGLAVGEAGVGAGWGTHSDWRDGWGLGLEFGTCPPVIACVPGTASSVPLPLEALNAVAGASLPAALLGSHSTAPRLHRYAETDLIVPALVRLGEHLLKPSALKEEGLRTVSGALAGVAGSSPSAGGSYVVDLSAPASPYMRLAAEALYYRHAAAVAVNLEEGTEDPFYVYRAGGGGPAAGSAFGAPVAGSDTPLSWPALLDAIVVGEAGVNAVAGGVPASAPGIAHGGGSAAATGAFLTGEARSVQRSQRSIHHVELLAALVSRHPDILPRGTPTAAVIRALSAELEQCRRRDDDSLAASLRALSVLAGVAASAAAEAEDVASALDRRGGYGRTGRRGRAGVPLSSGSTPDAASAAQLSGLHRAGITSSCAGPVAGDAAPILRRTFAATVACGDGCVRALAPYELPMHRLTIAAGATTPEQLNGASRTALISAFAPAPGACLLALSKSGSAGEAAAIASLTPEARWAGEAQTYRNLGAHVDAAFIHAVIRTSLASAAAEEAAAWAECLGALVTFLIPLGVSRRDALAQAGIRLVSRIISLGVEAAGGGGGTAAAAAVTSASVASSNGAAAPPAPPSSHHTAPQRVLLVPSTVIPQPHVPLTPSLLTRLFALPQLSDVRGSSRAADSKDMAGVVTAGKYDGTVLGASAVGGTAEYGLVALLCSGLFAHMIDPAATGPAAAMAMGRARDIVLFGGGGGGGGSNTEGGGSALSSSALLLMGAVGFEEVVEAGNTLCAYALANSCGGSAARGAGTAAGDWPPPPALISAVQPALEDRRALRALLWLLLRVRFDCREAYTRGRLDAAEAALQPQRTAVAAALALLCGCASTPHAQISLSIAQAASQPRSTSEMPLGTCVLFGGSGLPGGTRSSGAGGASTPFLPFLHSIAHLADADLPAAVGAALQRGDREGAVSSSSSSSSSSAAAAALLPRAAAPAPKRKAGAVEALEQAYSDGARPRAAPRSSSEAPFDGDSIPANSGSVSLADVALCLYLGGICEAFAAVAGVPLLHLSAGGGGSSRILIHIVRDSTCPTPLHLQRAVHISRLLLLAAPYLSPGPCPSPASRIIAGAWRDALACCMAYLCTHLPPVINACVAASGGFPGGLVPVATSSSSSPAFPPSGGGALDDDLFNSGRASIVVAGVASLVSELLLLLRGAHSEGRALGAREPLLSPPCLAACAQLQTLMLSFAQLLSNVPHSLCLPSPAALTALLSRSVAAGGLGSWDAGAGSSPLEAEPGKKRQRGAPSDTQEFSYRDLRLAGAEAEEEEEERGGSEEMARKAPRMRSLRDVSSQPAASSQAAPFHRAPSQQRATPSQRVTATLPDDDFDEEFGGGSLAASTATAKQARQAAAAAAAAASSAAMDAGDANDGDPSAGSSSLPDGAAGAGTRGTSPPRKAGSAAATERLIIGLLDAAASLDVIACAALSTAFLADFSSTAATDPSGGSGSAWVPGFIRQLRGAVSAERGTGGAGGGGQGRSRVQFTTVEYLRHIAHFGSVNTGGGVGACGALLSGAVALSTHRIAASTASALLGVISIHALADPAALCRGKGEDDGRGPVGAEAVAAAAGAVHTALLQSFRDRIIEAVGAACAPWARSVLAASACLANLICGSCLGEAAPLLDAMTGLLAVRRAARGPVQRGTELALESALRSVAEAPISRLSTCNGQEGALEALHTAARATAATVVSSHLSQQPSYAAAEPGVRGKLWNALPYFQNPQRMGKSFRQSVIPFLGGEPTLAAANTALPLDSTLFSAVSVIAGTLYSLEPHGELLDGPAARVSHMGLLSSLLELCGQEMDMVWEAISGRCAAMLQAAEEDARVRGKPPPKPDRAQPRWCNSLWPGHVIVQMGSNSADPGTRYAAARCLAVYSGEYVHDLLYARSNKVRATELDPLTDESYWVTNLGLPLPPMPLEECARNARFGAHEASGPGGIDSAWVSDGSGEDRYRSAIAAAASLVASDVYDEATQALVELLCRAGDAHPSSPGVRVALAVAARSGGFASLSALCAARLEPLCALWVERGLPIAALPFRALGFRTLGRLVRAWAHALIPAVLLRTARRRVRNAVARLSPSGGDEKGTPPDKRPHETLLQLHAALRRTLPPGAALPPIIEYFSHRCNGAEDYFLLDEACLGGCEDLQSGEGSDFRELFSVVDALLAEEDALDLQRAQAADERGGDAPVLNSSAGAPRSVAGGRLDISIYGRDDDDDMGDDGATSIGRVSVGGGRGAGNAARPRAAAPAAAAVADPFEVAPRSAPVAGGIKPSSCSAAASAAAASPLHSRTQQQRETVAGALVLHCLPSLLAQLCPLAHMGTSVVLEEQQQQGEGGEEEGDIPPAFPLVFAAGLAAALEVLHRGGALGLSVPRPPAKQSPAQWIQSALIPDPGPLAQQQQQQGAGKPTIASLLKAAMRTLGERGGPRRLVEAHLRLHALEPFVTRLLGSNRFNSQELLQHSHATLSLFASMCGTGKVRSGAAGGGPAPLSQLSTAPNGFLDGTQLAALPALLAALRGRLNGILRRAELSGQEQLPSCLDTLPPSAASAHLFLSPYKKFAHREARACVSTLLLVAEGVAAAAGAAPPLRLYAHAVRSANRALIAVALQVARAMGAAAQANRADTIDDWKPLLARVGAVRQALLGCLLQNKMQQQQAAPGDPGARVPILLFPFLRDARAAVAALCLAGASLADSLQRVPTLRPLLSPLNTGALGMGGEGDPGSVDAEQAQDPAKLILGDAHSMVRLLAAAASRAGGGGPGAALRGLIVPVLSRIHSDCTAMCGALAAAAAASSSSPPANQRESSIVGTAGSLRRIRLIAREAAAELGTAVATQVAPQASSADLCSALWLLTDTLQGLHTPQHVLSDGGGGSSPCSSGPGLLPSVTLAPVACAVARAGEVFASILGGAPGTSAYAAYGPPLSLSPPPTDLALHLLSGLAATLATACGSGNMAFADTESGASNWGVIASDPGSVGLQAAHCAGLLRLLEDRLHDAFALGDGAGLGSSLTPVSTPSETLCAIASDPYGHVQGHTHPMLVDAVGLLSPSLLSGGGAGGSAGTSPVNMIVGGGSGAAGEWVPVHHDKILQDRRVTRLQQLGPNVGAFAECRTPSEIATLPSCLLGYAPEHWAADSTGPKASPAAPSSSSAASSSGGGGACSPGTVVPARVLLQAARAPDVPLSTLTHFARVRLLGSLAEAIVGGEAESFSAAGEGRPAAWDAVATYPNASYVRLLTLEALALSESPVATRSPEVPVFPIPAPWVQLDIDGFPTAPYLHSAAQMLRQPLLAAALRCLSPRHRDALLPLRPPRPSLLRLREAAPAQGSDSVGASSLELLCAFSRLAVTRHALDCCAGQGGAAGDNGRPSVAYDALSPVVWGGGAAPPGAAGLPSLSLPSVGGLPRGAPSSAHVSLASVSRMAVFAAVGLCTDPGVRGGVRALACSPSMAEDMLPLLIALALEEAHQRTLRSGTPPPAPNPPSGSSLTLSHRAWAAAEAEEVLPCLVLPGPLELREAAQDSLLQHPSADGQAPRGEDRDGGQVQYGVGGFGAEAGARWLSWSRAKARAQLFKDPALLQQAPPTSNNSGAVGFQVPSAPPESSSRRVLVVSAAEVSAAAAAGKSLVLGLGASPAPPVGAPGFGAEGGGAGGLQHALGQWLRGLRSVSCPSVRVLLAARMEAVLRHYTTGGGGGGGGPGSPALPSPVQSGRGLAELLVRSHLRTLNLLRGVRGALAGAQAIGSHLDSESASAACEAFMDGVLGRGEDGDALEPGAYEEEATAAAAAAAAPPSVCSVPWGDAEAVAATLAIVTSCRVARRVQGLPLQNALPQQPSRKSDRAAAAGSPAAPSAAAAAAAIEEASEGPHSGSIRLAAALGLELDYGTVAAAASCLPSLQPSAHLYAALFCYDAFGGPMRGYASPVPPAVRALLSTAATAAAGVGRGAPGAPNPSTRSPFAKMLPSPIAPVPSPGPAGPAVPSATAASSAAAAVLFCGAPAGDSGSLHALLMRVYLDSGDPDAVYGLTGVSGLRGSMGGARDDHGVLGALAAHKGDWTSSLVFADAALSALSTPATADENEDVVMWAPGAVSALAPSLLGLGLRATVQLLDLSAGGAMGAWGGDPGAMAGAALGGSASGPSAPFRLAWTSGVPPAPPAPTKNRVPWTLRLRGTGDAPPLWSPRDLPSPQDAPYVQFDASMLVALRAVARPSVRVTPCTPTLFASASALLAPAGALDAVSSASAQSSLTARYAAGALVGLCAHAAAGAAGGAPRQQLLGRRVGELDLGALALTLSHAQLRGARDEGEVAEDPRNGGSTLLGGAAPGGDDGTLSSARTALLQALIARFAPSGAPGGQIAAPMVTRCLLQNGASKASALRRAGAWASAAVELDALGALVTRSGSGGGDASPQRITSSSGAVGSEDGDPELREAYRASNVGLLLLGRAKLAWAVNDASAALELVTAACARWTVAALASVSAMTRTLGSGSPSGPTSEGPSQLLMDACSQLCEALVTLARWLDSSGLDVAAAPNGGFTFNANINLEGWNVGVALPGDAPDQGQKPMPSSPGTGLTALGAELARLGRSLFGLEVGSGEPVDGGIGVLAPPAAPGATAVAGSIAAPSPRTPAPSAQAPRGGKQQQQLQAPLQGSTVQQQAQQQAASTAPFPSSSPASPVAVLGALKFGAVGGRSAAACLRAAERVADCLAALTAPSAAAPASRPPPALPGAPSEGGRYWLGSVSSQQRSHVRARVQLAVASHADAAYAAVVASAGSPEQRAIHSQRAERERRMAEVSRQCASFATKVKAAAARLTELRAKVKEAEDKLASAQPKLSASSAAASASASAPQGRPAALAAQLAELTTALRGAEAAHAAVYGNQVVMVSHRTELEMQINEDHAAAERVTRAIKEHRDRAIRAYTAFLRAVSSAGGGGGGTGTMEHTRVVFRLTSLWQAHAGDLQAMRVLGQELASVPGTAFLPALPQIASRLGEDGSGAALLPSVAELRDIARAGGAVPPSSSSSSSAALHLPGAPSNGAGDLVAALAAWGAAQVDWTSGSITEFLLLRMLVARPHTTALCLLALENGARVENEAYRFDKNKISAATRVLDTGAELSPPLRAAVVGLRMVGDAYIALATFNATSAAPGSAKQPEAVRSRSFPVADVLLDRWVGGQQGVALSTLPVAARRHNLGHMQPLPWMFTAPEAQPFTACLPIVTTGLLDGPPISTGTEGLGLLGPGGPAPYLQPVTMAGWPAKWSFVPTGVSFPRKLELCGNDGHVYPQIVKSTSKGTNTDDMRQDATMEQLFGLVNACLAASGPTSSRRLRLRTYKVVPFSPAAGAMEFVPNTMSLGGYLTDRPYAAHARYHPDELSFFEARAKLKATADALQAANKRGEPLRPLRSDPRLLSLAAVFEAVSPVFHHFFLDFFPSAEAWAVAQRAYSRSTATNSMVGYVAGIGDRHTNNILIDTLSGEVVHIDFGLALEQARLLPTPEQVFFRLTRDVVAGFGVNGVAGTFLRSCEDTLAVLRANEATLTTLMTVVVHDPLYRWAISPDQARRIERRRSGGASSASSLAPGEAGEPGGGFSAGGQRGSAAGAGGVEGSGEPGGGGGASSSAGGGGGGPARDPSIARLINEKLGGGGAASPMSTQAGGRSGGGGASSSAAAAADPERGRDGEDAAGPAAVESGAERALRRVRQKLLGADFAATAGRPLSVRDQVQRVVEEHQSFAKWALMFVGWSCWL